MNMNRAQLRQWPWNNRPSKRHVWYVASQNVDACKRCGTRFHRIADAPSGAIYCHPTPNWLREHPDDDRAEG
jgi:hypothetical protein